MASHSAGGRRTTEEWMDIAVDALAVLARHDDFLTVEDLADDLGWAPDVVKNALRRAFLADAAPRRPVAMILELDGPPGWGERDGAWDRVRLAPGLPFPVRPMTVAEIQLLLLAARFVLDNADVRAGFAEFADPLSEAAEVLRAFVRHDDGLLQVRADLARTPDLVAIQGLVGQPAAFRYRRRFREGHFDSEVPVEWKRHEMWVDSVRFDRGRWMVETRALDTGRPLTFRGEYVDDVEAINGVEPEAPEREELPEDVTVVRLRCTIEDEDDLLRHDASVIAREESTSVVELPFYGQVRERVTHLVLGLDRSTTVLEPPELRDVPADAIREILAQYEDAGD